MTPRPPLLVATHNPGKVEEFKAMFAGKVATVSPFDEPLQSIEFPGVEENGDTYHANALIKARAYQKIYGLAVLSDDSGFEIEPLGNRPGLYSARYGGKITFPQRWELLYRELAAVPTERWRARFRCVLCFLPISGEPRYFEGTTEGKMVKPPRGEGGFGYDPVFQSDVLGKTFGEATPAEKDAISHRSVALQKFLTVWQSGEALS